MPSFIRNTSGGKAISGGALAPRSRRGNSVAQVDAYWLGGATGPDATGGIGAAISTGTGYNYLQFNATGNLTVTSAGIFEFKIFGGGGGGATGNGYNSFGRGGGKGGTGNITATLAAGTYLITVGAGGRGPTGQSDYSSTSGTASSVAGYTGGAEIGAGGGTAATGNTAGLNGAGDAGTEVNTFIGGASLFKAAGGGNSITGIGGSGIGGNGGNGSPGNQTAAAANTASGGGGHGGSNLPDLFTGYGGNGGTGIVYVRWLA